MTQSTKALELRRVLLGRVAAAFLVLGGLIATVGVSGTSGAAGRLTISTLKTTKFGTVLVSGKTVYTLKPIGAGCNAACLKIWPEVLLPKGVTKATAGPGVSAAKLGTVKRASGALQVTYAGKALYWFALDTAPGQVKGNVTDTWGKWTDVATIKPKSGGTTTTTGGGTTTTTPGGGGGIGF
jgi:predicted lipoprotein with Yx(FWY)xxD motif